MLSSPFALLLFATFVAAKFQTFPSPNSNVRQASDYFVEAVGALDKLVWFLQGHYHEGNLDLFIGTRIAEGQLSTLLDHVKDGNSDKFHLMSEDMILRLKSIQDQLTFISDRGVLLVKEKEPRYFESIGGIIGRNVWDIDYSAVKKVNKTLIAESQGKETIKEAQSDACIHQMMASAWGPNGKCRLPDECWAMMTAPNFYGYSLTHQLFLLEIGAKVGCVDELKRLAVYSGMTITAVADGICSNVFAQAQQISQADFPHGKRDIFMEQVALCGILGYSNFFQTAWLEKILSWQKAEGCYGYYIANGESLARSRIHAIAKREEKRMKDGCSSHRTAVAAAALGANVKYLALFATLNN